MSHFEDYKENIENNHFPKPEPFIKDYIDNLIQGELVENVDVKRIRDAFIGSTYAMSARSVLGCTTPTLAWAREIKKVVGEGTVLEVGAGTGLVAQYLNAVGINIIATDNFNYMDHEKNTWKLYFDVERLDFKDAIQKYSADFLLLCFPIDTSLAWEASELFTKLNPDGKILYSGEWYGGANADKKFFDGTIVLNYMEEANKLYPLWPGLHDQMYLMKWIGVPSNYDETHKSSSDDSDDTEEEAF